LPFSIANPKFFYIFLGKVKGCFPTRQITLFLPLLRAEKGAKLTARRRAVLLRIKN
jgi:hypothetical protein